MDIELDMPAGHAVLLGGESLSRLSNHWLQPGIHQVAHVASERLSCPFQLLAAAGANLGCSAEESVVGPILSECMEVV